jgi:hypothetical protein
VTMRWPIATGSSMGMGAFQIHDELVSASLYENYRRYPLTVG